MPETISTRYPGAQPAVHIRGVSLPNRRARATERKLAVIVVIVPFLALVGAIALLWNRSVGLTEISLLAGMYVVGIIGIGVGFHRLFSHRAFQTTTTIKVVLGIMGSAAAQGPLLFWAAIHRRHHAFSDREGDPHSPHLHGPGVLNFFRGFWHAHTGWLFIPEVHDLGVFVPDLMRDSLVFKVSRLYLWWVLLGLAVPAALGGLLSGTWVGALRGLFWGGLVRIALGHHTTWSVNSICHIYGKRPYRSKDLSRNNFWLALPSFGEAWHNNHHAFPTSAFHGLEWWQIDISGYLIRLLARMGLAWDVKRPSTRNLAEASLGAGAESKM